MNPKYDQGISSKVDGSSSKNGKGNMHESINTVADFSSLPEEKSVITLAGNLAIGGGNFIVINTTDGKEDIDKIIEKINEISPNAVTQLIEAIADKISRDK